MQAKTLILEAHYTTHIEGTHLTLDQSQQLLTGNKIINADPEDRQELFISYQGKRLGFEFKCTDQPKVTKSIVSAHDSLSLDHLFIVTPIEETFLLDEQTTVLALKDYQNQVLP